MEYQNILELWDRFEDSKATEMVLDFQGTHFSLKKVDHSDREDAKLHECLSNSNPAISPKLPVSIDHAMPIESSVKSDKAKLSDDSASPENLIPIKAPLVGTFYAAPSPDADPFVRIGKEVKKGDVIGIIEAMKLMNELTASEDGIVKEILAADGDFVAYDQTLILLAGR